MWAREWSVSDTTDRWGKVREWGQSSRCSHHWPWQGLKGAGAFIYLLFLNVQEGLLEIFMSWELNDKNEPTIRRTGIRVFWAEGIVYAQIEGGIVCFWGTEKW